MARRPSAPGWPVLRWVALLGFALLAPATLPAGGGERRIPEVRRRQSASEPWLSASILTLRCAPERQAPVLASVEAGEPLRVLRHWLSPRGRRWLQVEIAVGNGVAPRRGWLAG
ncbi:MAG: SH3 domain-containing protein [Cyanobium sp.]